MIPMLRVFSSGTCRAISVSVLSVFGQKKGPDRAGAASCARPDVVYVVGVSIDVNDRPPRSG
jgi:hypothetical protein